MMTLWRLQMINPRARAPPASTASLVIFIYLRGSLELRAVVIIRCCDTNEDASALFAVIALCCGMYCMGPDHTGRKRRRTPRIDYSKHVKGGRLDGARATANSRMIPGNSPSRASIGTHIEDYPPGRHPPRWHRKLAMSSLRGT